MYVCVHIYKQYICLYIYIYIDYLYINKEELLFLLLLSFIFGINPFQSSNCAPRNNYFFLTIQSCKICKGIDT